MDPEGTTVETFRGKGRLAGARALRVALTSRLPDSPQAKLSGSWRGIKEPPTPATFWNAGS